MSQSKPKFELLAKSDFPFVRYLNRETDTGRQTDRQKRIRKPFYRTHGTLKHVDLVNVYILKNNVSNLNILIFFQMLKNKKVKTNIYFFTLLQYIKEKNSLNYVELSKEDNII